MADLKREIKKLQRYREDIMKWVSNPEVKDKSSLGESRRRIEVEMERFKAFERESKTKPFSLIGLAMGGRLDAQEQKKQEKRESIEELVEKLTMESDEFRAEWETLLAKKKKNKEEITRTDDLKKFSDWHGFHLRSLEQVLRRLDNDLIDPDDVDSLIESLHLYMEQYGDFEFYHDEQLYDQYNLDSDAVDETYYKRTLEEIAENAKSAAASSSAPAEVPKVREVPLTAAAKARAKKVAAAGTGGVVRPDHPVQHPPKPVRPTTPSIAPPALPAFQSHPPARPAPVFPGMMPEASKPSVGVWRQDAGRSDVRPPPPPPVPGSVSEIGQLLEMSFRTRPSCEDLVRVRSNAPSNPYPAAFRINQGLSETAALMRKLPVDTLMLIFYYREGTASQFLASQELKRQKWRFHKKFGVWFRRVAVRTTTPSFEFGSYDLFDLSETWSVKSRNDFTFEYEYLEEDQVPVDSSVSPESAIRRPQQ